MGSQRRVFEVRVGGIVVNFDPVAKGFRVKGCLRQQPVRRRDTEDTAECGGCAQKHNIPRVPAWLFDAVPLDRADNAADLVIEIEQHRDDGSRDDTDKHPLDGHLPEFHKEGVS